MLLPSAALSTRPGEWRAHCQKGGGRGGPDNRPDVERRKGGIKLFVGRIPQEASEHLLRATFEKFGDVLEVFNMRGERPGEERHSECCRCYIRTLYKYINTYCNSIKILL